MPDRRRHLPALLGVLTLAGLLATWAWLPRPPAPVATADSRPVAALPLALPPPAAPAATPSPARQAAPAASAGAGDPPATERIGSEGYGPHIDDARAGHDPQAIWQAVQWLQQCAANEQLRHGYEQARNLGSDARVMTQLMTQADAEARRCQTVTAQHRALLPELAASAMRAGVPHAAAAYADAVSPASLSPAQRQEVADALRHDALAQGAMGLLSALQADPAWGLDEPERLAYLAALKQLTADDPGGFNLVRVLLQQSDIQFKPAPTPEQLDAARRRGQQIAAQILGGPKP